MLFKKGAVDEERSSRRELECHKRRCEWSITKGLLA